MRTQLRETELEKIHDEATDKLLAVIGALRAGAKTVEEIEEYIDANRA